MKGGPKSSHRPFLHRALQLLYLIAGKQTEILKSMAMNTKQ